MKFKIAVKLYIVCVFTIQSELPKPGLVPKELYGSCEHSDEDWGFDALYQRATVTKGSPHEVGYHGYV